MADDRLRRIRLVSARFQELQGLRIALVGVSIAVVTGAYLAVAPAPSDAGAMAALLAAFVPAIPGVRWLNRYYAATFGRQVAARTPARWQGLMLLGYLAVGIWLNASYPEIPAGTPTVATAALAAVWLAMRDWPWRAYYLAVPAAVGSAFTMSASGVGLFGPGLTLAMIFLALGTSFVVVGLLDHWVLVRLLREAREMGMSPVAASAAGPPDHR